MTLLSTLNPARRLVGRLFLWFWLTTLLTAVVAISVSRMIEDEVEIDTPHPRQVQQLSRLASRLQQITEPDIPLESVLDRMGRRQPFRLLAIEQQSGKLVRGGGPPPRRVTVERLMRLTGQQSAITLRQRDFAITGPQPFTWNNQQYVLFITDRVGPGDPAEPLKWLLGVGLMVSVLLSYLFARTLVKPIHQIQQASQKLALGDWQARASTGGRRDELGQLAEDFNQMAGQLETLWRGQQRLLGDISHELRSPLTRLQMALGLAHQQNVDTPTLDRIERETERMEQLINQLLALTRAEASRPQMELVGVDALLEPILQDARFEADNHHKALHWQTLPSCTLMATPTLLGSGIENVIRNAIKYATDTIEVAVIVQEHTLIMHIDDNGPGLDSSEQDAIFTPFYRASLARDRQSGGVGLGLAIAKAAVTAHHGSIRAQDSASGGLRVTLHLPLKS